MTFKFCFQIQLAPLEVGRVLPKYFPQIFGPQVGRCTLTLSKPVLKAPAIERLKL